ncbi:MAG: hypothetical protein QGH21_00780 [Candidatus Poseidoniia archaeon]|jgi:hypothetical protein|nr:hypothetical protein [Candidatus Poseidoniia archaeon]
MTENTTPENLQKFLKSDDPAQVRMGLSLAKEMQSSEEYELTLLKTLQNLLGCEDNSLRKTGLLLVKDLKKKAAYQQILALAIWDTDIVNREISFQIIKENIVENEFAGWDLKRNILDGEDPMLPLHQDNYPLLDEYQLLEFIEELGNQKRNSFHKSAVFPLIRALQNDEIVNEYRERDHYIRCRAAGALGLIGDKRAVTYLVEQIDNGVGNFDKRGYIVDPDWAQELELYAWELCLEALFIICGADAYNDLLSTDPLRGTLQWVADLIDTGKIDPSWETEYAFHYCKK